MKPEDVKKVYQGAFVHGIESSNHLMVRFDELNQTWDNLLSELWNNPEAKATDVLPNVEAAVNEALERIAQEAEYEFK
jgi:multiple sugar transport system substrate-binding protein